MPELPVTYDRLTDMLPEYSCGLIWLVDIAFVIALTVTSHDAIVASQTVALALRPFHVPDLAVGFILAAAGVLLPYSIARATNPIVITVLNAIRQRWYRDRRDSSVTTEHISLAESALTRRGLPVPVDDYSLVIVPFLLQIGSPVVSSLSARRQSFHDRAYVAVPISLLLGLGTFALLFARPPLAVTIGVCVAVLVLAATVHRAQMSLVRWEAEVLFAFLAIDVLVEQHALVK
jgi:hypothetical protein